MQETSFSFSDFHQKETLFHVNLLTTYYKSGYVCDKEMFVFTRIFDNFVICKHINNVCQWIVPCEFRCRRNAENFRSEDFFTRKNNQLYSTIQNKQPMTDGQQTPWDYNSPPKALYKQSLLPLSFFRSNTASIFLMLTSNCI